MFDTPRSSRRNLAVARATSPAHGACVDRAFFFGCDPVNTCMALPSNCVVKFTAEWCGPCQRIKEPLHRLVKGYDVVFLEVDVDSDSPLPAVYKVTSMPTIIVVCDGKEVPELRVVGADMQKIAESVARLRALLDERDGRGNQISLPHSDHATVECRTTIPKGKKS